MKHVMKFKDALKIKIMALLAVCAMIALSATVVVLADEIIVAEADRQADDSAAYTESEESRKQEFIDPHYYVQDIEVIETETIEEPEEAEAELTLGEQIADFAYSFVDWLPYVWGGESLEYGADCCGFTQAIYRAFGIEIPRTVEEQAYIGYSVSLEDAQPGDIVIYYGHVGLYAGDGMIIHSPYPGTCVSYESVYDQEIQDIRRII
ncbi:MAG: NlpC/P60 family protein [Lachnospiraceae bacterium]|nr:NlpC/P60 family protein [Lachnospiraceae bacterium]